MNEGNAQTSSSAKLTVYKCPSCSGAVRFDATTGKLACRWCGNEYAAGQLEVKEVSSELNGYECPECGAELMMDDFMASITCPYCGNNEVAPRRFDGVFKPDRIIPFKVTKRRALECYEEMLAQKDYLPDDYAQEAQITSVQGTYVPFWLGAGVVDFDFTWWCTDGAGKNSSSCHRRRVGTFAFSSVPADGSERMRDDLMDSVEPYDHGELVPYSPDFLPGFLAERFTVGSEDVAGRIDRRVKNSALHAAAETIESKWKNRFPDEKRSRATVAFGDCELALLPVWLIVVVYKGVKYHVGVNGQTGKVAVNLPIDPGKQGKKTRKSTVSDILMTLSVIAFAIILVLVIGISSGSFEGVDLLHPNWSALDGGEIAFVAAIAVAFLGMLVLFAAGAYIRAKREVKDSMHNVAEAQDADDFIEEGNLSLSFSGNKKGPRQEQDNWPV